MAGASISHFLLEKSRIVTQNEGERNYHIFYQLCNALEEADRAPLGLGKPEDYKLLTVGNCTTDPTIDDEQDWERVRVCY